MYLSDDAFAHMVAEEVKNKLSPVHKQKLMEKENWERWRQALLILSEKMTDQIDSLNADASADEERYTSMGRSGARLAQEARSAYSEKIKKASRFKFHVDKRLDEVTLMIDTGKLISSDGWEDVEFLKRAIATHRSMIREFDLEETAIDRALWSALSGNWEFDKIDQSAIWDNDGQ